MDVELDHILVFVDADAVPVKSLESAGLHVMGQHGHPGQGTANRSVLFSNAYLELIFLTSRDDATRNALRLDRRADWKVTGASPFGLGLRAEMTDADREACRPYVAPYASPGRPPLWIVPATWDDHRLPLMFVQEPWGGRTLAAMRPEAWSREFVGSALDHPCGARRVVGATIEILDRPSSPSWPPIRDVTIRSGPSPIVTVEIDAAGPFEITPLPHLVVRSAVSA